MNIIIVDDHSIFAELIGEFLNSKGHKVLTAYNNATDLQNSEILNLADLILLDLGLPDSEETENIKFLNENYPNIKILVFTSNVNPSLLIELFQLGVNGYLPKTKDKSRLLEVIDLVEKGEKHFESVNISDFMSYQKESYLDISLTKRELEVLKLSGKSLNNDDISKELNLSINTIKTYKKNLNKKFDVNSTEDLVLKARRKGVI